MKLLGSNITQRARDAIVVVVFWGACFTTAYADQIFVDPVTAVPDENQVVRFSVAVDEVPAPGFRSYALNVRFDGTAVNLVDSINSFSSPLPADQVSCAATLRQGAASETVIPGTGVILESGQGAFVLDSQGTGTLLVADNRIVSADTAQYSVGVAGETGVVTPQVGGGSLIDFLCYVGADVPQGTSVSVTPGLYPGVDGAILLDESGADPIINTFRSGTIQIGQATNEPPELGAIGNQGVDEGGTLNIGLGASDLDNDTLTFAQTGLPAFCTLTDNGDGTGAIDCAPQFGDAGSYEITVTVTDDGTPNLSDDETFTLTVGDVNRAPELGAIGNRGVEEGGTLNIGLGASDLDNDTLTFGQTGLPAFCTLTDNGDGTGAIDCAPQFGDAGSYEITVTVTDDGVGNLSDSETFTLTVGDVNRAPVLGAIGTQGVDEDGALNIGLSASDPDNDTLTFAQTGVPGFCTLSDNGNGSGAIDCAPGFEDAGSYPVTVSVTDDGVGNLSDSETFTLTVNDINQAPVLDPIGNQPVQENELLEIFLSATDADGDALSFEVGDAPTGAELIDNGDGTAVFRWTPSFAQAGNFTPIFIVTDDGVPMGRAEERITITVGDVNQLPVLDPINDQPVGEGQALTVPLLADDPDGDALSFSETGLPAFCSLTDNGDGTGAIDCAPQFGDAGNYAITVTVTDDGEGTLSDSEPFILSVGDVNRVPELDTIGDRTVDEGALLQIALTASDEDDDGLTLSETGLPVFCTLTDNGDGSGFIDCAPQFGDAGNYAITVTVTDDGVGNLSDSETFTLTVGDVNRAPELGAIGNQDVDEDGTLNIGLSASDPDNDTLTFTQTGLPDFCGFTDNGDRTGAIDCAPQFGDAGNYEITVTVTDDGVGNLSDSATFTLTVGDVNRAPELGAIGNQDVDEDGTLNFGLSASDLDNDTLTFSQTGLPAFCTLTDNGDGTGAIDCAPQFGDAGSYEITVTVTDDGVGNLSDSETFTLTVGEVNREPVLGAIGTQGVDEDGTLNIGLGASDLDNDTLTFAQTGLPAFCTLTDNGDGTGAIDCAPQFGDAGSYEITVTVTDDGTPNLSDDETFTLTVGDVNRAPELGAIGNRGVDEGGTLNIGLGASDLDNDTLTFGQTGLPAFCTLTDNGDGTGAIDCAPQFGDAGSYEITVTVTDDGVGNLSDSETFTLTVGDVNRAPVLGAIGTQGVDEDGALNIGLSASDPDNDTLTFAQTGVPGFCTLSDNGNGSGAIDCAPGFEDAGSYPVTVSVTDDGVGNLSDSETFTLTVNDINQAPVLDPIGNQPVQENELLEIFLSATDADGDALSFEVGDAPTGAELIDNGDGTAVFRWTPSFAQAGNFTPIFIVTDDGVPMGRAEERITITVGDVNQLPVLDPINNQDVGEGGALNIGLSADDLDEDTLTFTQTGLPDFCGLTDNGDRTGLIDCAPGFGDAGNYAITVTVTDDGEGTLSDSEPFILSVGDVNRVPELDTIGDRTVDEGALLQIALTASDEDDDGLTLSETGLPVFCTLTDNGDGSGFIDCAPQFGDAGNYAITVTVTDDGVGNLSDSETFTLTVGDVNRAPELGAIGNQDVDEDGTLNIGLSASDPDNDTLTFTQTGLPDFCGFTDNGDRTGAIDCAPQFGDAGNYEITVTVTDDGVGNLSDSATFTLTVGDVNRAPELGAIGTRDVDEDGTLNFGLSASDLDNDTLTFSQTGLPAFCTLTDNGDGTGAIDCAPQFGDAGSYEITVTVTDDGVVNLSDSETFTLTVGEVNREPVLGAIGTQGVDEDGTLNIGLGASDLDNDTLTFTQTGLPAFCTLTDNGDGTGAIDCAPQFGDAGSYEITVTVTDDGTPNLSDDETFTLTVGDVNRAPELGAIGTQGVDEDGTLNIGLSASDLDNDTLTFGQTGLPAFCTLTDNGDGTGAIDCAPQFGDAGSYEITVTVTDDGTPNLSDDETFTLTVGDVNRAPELGAIGTQGVDEDGTLNIGLSANDLDNDTLTFGQTGLPAFCGLTDNGNGTGAIDCAPQFGDAGSYEITVTVTDDGTPNLSDSETFTLTVNDINQAPVLDPIGNQPVQENELLEIFLSATDADGDALSFEVGDAPTGAELIDNGDGTAAFRWTPSFAQAGNFTPIFIVTDDGVPMGRAEERITITVGDVNSQPELGAIGNQDVGEGGALNIGLSADDLDEDTLTFTQTGLPDFCGLTDNGDRTGLIDCAPGFDDAGSYEITVTVTDDGDPNLSDSETFTLTVGDGNREPELDTIGDRTVDEGASLEIALTASDEVDDGLTLSETGLPVFCTLTDNGDGSGFIDCAPQFGDAGNYAITVTVTDDGVGNLSDSETFTLTVGDVNRAPELGAIGNQGVNEGGTLNIGLSASDPDNDTLTFTQTGLPDFCGLTDNGDRTGAIDCAPQFGDAGNYETTVTVTDNGAPQESDAETFSITVSGISDPPVLSSVGDRQVAEGELLEIILTAYDPNGDGLSYMVSNLPAGATFVDYGDGFAVFSWIPEVSQAGEYPVTFTVTDDSIDLQSDEEEIVITVTAANDQETMLCANLGDDRYRWFLDRDKFRFDGTKGETVTVSLEQSAVGTGSGERATLLLIDKIRKVHLLRIDSTRLPNRIQVNLPATGSYQVIIAEQSRFARGKRFTGDYCLTMESTGSAYQTLRTTGSVE